MNRTIIFKEVLETEALEECFSLRDEYFNNPRHKVLLKSNVEGIDMDEYDMYARHWAVYSENGELIGYARIIQEHVNTNIVSSIMELAKKYSVEEVYHRNKAMAFPLSEYQESGSAQTIQSIFNSEQAMVELSRFVIKRGNPSKISTFMVEAGLGIYAYYFKIRTIILACMISHERFWSRYGFKRIEANETYYVGELKSVNLLSSFDEVSYQRKRALVRFAREYDLNNEISLRI